MLGTVADPEAEAAETSCTLLALSATGTAGGPVDQQSMLAGVHPIDTQVGLPNTCCLQIAVMSSQHDRQSRRLPDKPVTTNCRHLHAC